MDAVDSKTLEALGGRITKVTVSSGRKLTDGYWGSIEGSFVFEMEVPPGADPAALATAGYEYAKAVVVNTVVADGEALQAQNAGKKAAEKAPQAPQQAPTAPQAPKAAPSTRKASDGSEDREFRIVDVEYFAVEVGADGIRKAKAFGGPFKKYGVKVWPEPLEPLGIDLNTLEAGKFSLPEGYTRAKVLLNAEGNPKKVWQFLKAEEPEPVGDL